MFRLQTGSPDFGIMYSFAELKVRKIVLMSSLTRNTIVLALVFFCAGLHSPTYSQTKTPKKMATATVSGRVTVGGKGRGGILVGLARADFPRSQSPPHKASTDPDGNYRITGVPAGSYYVAAMASSFVLADASLANGMGTPLLLEEGESVQGIDIALVRGCVITGKVTDAERRPVIEQRVNVISTDQPNQPGPMNPIGPPSQTDDRGIYRIFGLRAGRYKVSVGQSDDNFGGGFSPGRATYQRVFYPDVTDVDQAKIVELAEGDQASNIDITMARTLPGFAVTGTIINGETNQPTSNVRVALQRVVGDRNSFFPAYATSNERGEFRLGNIPPGTYSLFLYPQLNNDFRADPLKFQLVDQDVTGLVVRTVRGASISGTVVMEEANDPTLVAKVRQLRVYAWVRGGDVSGSVQPSAVSADGSFRLSGLPAGIVNFQFASRDGMPATGFVMSRVERDGVVLPPGSFEIKAAEQISGVRIVLTYGSGTVHGTVNFQNGPPAPGLRFIVRLSKPGDNAFGLQPREVDARGRFIIEGVPAGAYDLYVNAFNSGSRERLQSATQSITVAEGAVTEVVISIDLAHRP